MPKSRFRDWLAVAAHFRRSGPMKHKNTPRGGSGTAPEISEGLDEYRAEQNSSETKEEEKNSQNKPVSPTPTNRRA